MIMGALLTLYWVKFFATCALMVVLFFAIRKGVFYAADVLLKKNR